MSARKGRSLPVGLAAAVLAIAALAGCSDGGSEVTRSSSGSPGNRQGLPAPSERDASGPAAKDLAVEKPGVEKPGVEKPGVQKPGAQGPGAQGPGATEAGKGSPAQGVSAPTDLGRRLTRTAQVRLASPDVPGAAAQVRKIAADAGGYLSDERTSTGRPGAGGPGTVGGTTDLPDLAGTEIPPAQPGTSVLTLRVPTARLDQVLQRLADVGPVLSQSQTSQDVTGEYVDTASRIANQQASVARVRALLARADTLGDVVQIEGELTRRQADLESLQARLAQLKDQTTLSTLTVSIGRPARPAVATKGIDRGFFGGLAAGWRALISGSGVALTVVGAVLPFLGLAALLAAPLVLRTRRRNRLSRCTVAASASPNPGQPAVPDPTSPTVPNPGPSAQPAS
jgi:hypothetical protein